MPPPPGAADPLEGLAIDDENDPLADIAVPDEPETGDYDPNDASRAQGLSAIPAGTRDTGQRVIQVPGFDFRVDPGTVSDRSQDRALGEHVEYRGAAPAPPPPEPAPGLMDRLSGLAAMAPNERGRAIFDAIRDPDIGATLMGAAQGAGLGFMDEIHGARQAVGARAAGAGFSPELLRLLAITPEAQQAGVRGEGMGSVYEQERNRARGIDAELQERSPISYGGGAIAGSLPYAAIPGGGGSFAARVGTQTAIGAGLGALEGAGRSEAEDLGGLASDAGEGALVGSALSAGGTMIGEGTGYGLRRLGQWAANRAPGAQRAATQMGLEARGIWGRDAMEQAREFPGGQEALLGRLDELQAPLHARDMPAFIDRQLQEQGERVGGVVREMDESGARVDTAPIIDRLEALAREQDADVITGAGPARALRERARGLAELPTAEYGGGGDAAPQLGFGQSHHQRRSIDQLVNWQNPDPSVASLQGQRVEMRRALSDAMQGAADEAGRGPEWTAANRGYSLAAELDDIARGYERRNVQGGMAGAQSRAAGFGRMITGPGLLGRAQGAVEAVAGPAAMQELRYAWPGMAYRGLQNLPPRLRALGPQGARWAGMLEQAARRGSTALAAAHFALSRTDPSYRAAVEQTQGQEEE